MFIVNKKLCILYISCTFSSSLAQADSFLNVTREAGLSGVSQQNECAVPSGMVIGRNVSVADVNGDHYPDLLLHLPLNEGTGDVLNKQCLYLNVPGNDPSDPHSRKYVDFTSESGIRSNRRGTNEGRHSSFSVFADIDNDGDLDMFSGLYAHHIQNYSDIGDRNDLYLNDGTGHFSLAPNSPFHLESIHNTSSAVFTDFNNDGNLDLFIGNWYKPKPKMSEDILYQGDGKGGFTNVNLTAGLSGTLTAVYSVTATDWNNDGYSDLLVPSYSRTQPNAKSILWENNGDGTFSQVQDAVKYAPFEGYSSPVAAFGSMPRDYDNDGDMDILELLVHGKENGVKTTILNNEDGLFSWDFATLPRPGGDGTEKFDMQDHQGSWLDFDNDGLADILLSRCCNKDLNDNWLNWLTLFKQQPDHTFDVVTASAGFSVINDAILRVHNVIPLDFDLDGDEDLLVGFASGTEGVQLWRNEEGTVNNWITIHLEGDERSNQSAIGARVEVTVGKGTVEETTYTREVNAGLGQFGPQAPLDLTFGLGQAQQVDSIKVRWPNKNLSEGVIHNVPVNQFISLAETHSLVGDKDNFHPHDAIDIPPRSQCVKNMLSDINNIGGQGSGVNLDVNGIDRPVGLTHYFALSNQAKITSARIKFRVRSTDNLIKNDGVFYDCSSLPSQDGTPVIALRHLLGREPLAGEDHTLEINLAKVPVILTPLPGAGQSQPTQPTEYRSLLSSLQNGQFDMVYSDDLEIDFSELNITYVLPSAPLGDLTGDDKVDRNDLDILRGALNTETYAGDPRDIDGDGRITVLDMRKAVLLCNRLRCATE